MKGYLIDPFAKTVTEVETTGELNDIYRLTDCDIIEAIYLPKGDHIYVDEEGLQADDNGLVRGREQQFFMVGRSGQIYGGKGLWLGSDGGEETDPKISFAKARDLVNFPM